MAARKATTKHAAPRARQSAATHKQPTKQAAKPSAAATAQDGAKTGAFADLIRQYPPHVQAIAQPLRAIVYEVLPRAEEQVWIRGWRIALYKDGAELCGIGPLKNYCNFYLTHGAHLADPEGLLEGTGKGMRHVKVRALDDLPIAGIKRLIRADKQFVRRGLTTK